MTTSTAAAAPKQMTPEFTRTFCIACVVYGEAMDVPTCELVNVMCFGSCQPVGQIFCDNAMSFSTVSDFKP
jgi:hypothetical protein